LAEQLVAGEIPMYGCNKRYITKAGGRLGAVTVSLLRDSQNQPWASSASSRTSPRTSAFEEAEARPRSRRSLEPGEERASSRDEP
jgi:hypothetical protein